jgi:putative restriction endonuclease
MKAVFTTRIGSGYDDVVEERYHFPRTYLRQAENAVGDFILYYEPRRTGEANLGGQQAYFAVARVEAIKPDPRGDGLFYATIADYLNFERPVPFREDGRYFESMLRRPDGETSKGAFGRAVRNIPDAEFDLILRAGFPFPDSEPASSRPYELDDQPQQILERPLIEVTVSRRFRDRVFTRNIQDAYGKTCAVTGLNILNGGGRGEVQAAHIRPVADDGPDSVRNGIALSGTIHWMFDRGLISIAPDYGILVAASGVPDPIRRLIRPEGRIGLPTDRAQWPHQHYLNFHRSNIFKG